MFLDVLSLFKTKIERDQPNTGPLPVAIELSEISAVPPQKLRDKIPQGNLTFAAAKMFLDDNVFVNENHLYSEKLEVTECVLHVFKQLTSLKDISNLFDYILLPDNKAQINVHYHHKLDRFLLFKMNTRSWQELIKQIRVIACEKLKLELGIDFENLEIRNYHPELRFLQDYREKEIFSLHRSNNLLDRLCSTKTCSEINEIIDKLSELQSAPRPYD